MDNNVAALRTFFDARAESYHRVSKWATNPDVNRITDKWLSALRGTVALDLGAGTGVLISRLKHFSRRIAVDISPKMLALTEDPDVEKVVGDIQSLSFPSDFADLIICRQVLHYCDLDLAFRNIKRVLKKDGFVHIVQVVEIKGVPLAWDNEWARFRGISIRRHLRTADLEAAYQVHSLKVIKERRHVIIEQYNWKEFFLKHSIDKAKEVATMRFFTDAPQYIRHAIDLKVGADGISYQRNIGFWLLQDE